MNLSILPDRFFPLELRAIPTDLDENPAFTLVFEHRIRAFLGDVNIYVQSLTRTNLSDVEAENRRVSELIRIVTPQEGDFMFLNHSAQQREFYSSPDLEAFAFTRVLEVIPMNDLVTYSRYLCHPLVSDPSLPAELVSNRVVAGDKLFVCGGIVPIFKRHFGSFLEPSTPTSIAPLPL